MIRWEKDTRPKAGGFRDRERDTMSRNTINKQRGWKWAFLILLFLNALLLVWLARVLTAPVDYTSTGSPNRGDSVNDLTAVATLGAEDLELLMQGALNKYEEAEGLAVRVSDSVELEGLFTVWGLTIPYLVEGEPFVTQSGDLQVKVEDIYLGRLTLPNQQVLSLLATQLEPSLPLTINSQDEWFTIHLTHFQAENGLAVKLLQIAKDTQEYTFEITLPRENLLQ